MKAATIVILILFPLIALAETVSETKDLVLSAGEIDTLVVNCGAGSFHLRGADDQVCPGQCAVNTEKTRATSDIPE
jgi:hypothetical protein